MREYTVKEGDTISSISTLFGINRNDLIELNKLENIYYLEPGRKLMIPEGTNETDRDLFEYYTVQKGDNLYKIGNQYGIDHNTLAEMNGLEINEYIHPGDKLLIPKRGVSVYITKEEDKLQELASRFNVPIEKLLEYNKNIYLLPEQLLAYIKE